ncbi:hypothetical protein TWF191_001520 [Orbilia oligospora]|uniref:Uncharacterized protein n=1 Tax=Orbilia oligospora TaxID=2813651 RepID=A0A7C8U9V3_ORBOL|nr:hypothetical protein TWF191_001520 [Orbilia oligospora]
MADGGWLYSDGGRQRFNATILKQYGYVIYPNNTISNYSSCVLAFGGYIPTVIGNGSWYNSTGCDTPVRPIRTRGIVGIVAAIIFGVLLVLSLVALNKHGKSFLPAEKRFRLVGRRWPWYWCIITTSVGMISGFTAVDVDRVWVLGTAAIFHFIFYLVTLPACLSAIWEMTRNWASFEERKGVDEDFTRYRQDDLRSKIEFYEPLLFYLFNFLSFFLSILRAWNPIARSNIPSNTGIYILSWLFTRDSGHLGHLVFRLERAKRGSGIAASEEYSECDPRPRDVNHAGQKIYRETWD